MELLLLIVSFIASLIGAICGIGGGVITKPVLDGLQLPGLGIAELSFLSSISVLAMAIYSISNIYIKKNSQIILRDSLPMGVGAAIGGLLGKIGFQAMISTGDSNPAGRIQAFILLALTIGTFLYALFQDKIPSFNVKSWMISFLAGLLLGLFSAFLGIGGGPINLVVLGVLFSMNPKVGAQNSLLIILISQIVSMIHTFVSRSVPDVRIVYVLVMIAGGLLGAMIGRKLNLRMSTESVRKLFLAANVLIILISVYNAVIRS